MGKLALNGPLLIFRAMERGYFIRKKANQGKCGSAFPFSRFSRAFLYHIPTPHAHLPIPNSLHIPSLPQDNKEGKFIPKTLKSTHFVTVNRMCTFFRLNRKFDEIC